MVSTRPAAVAGTFYPANAKELESTVRDMLTRVVDAAGAVPQGPVPKAIIAPHAGYVYSGPVAASAYARLLPAADRITRVILLGPCHRVAVRGLAVSSAEAFSTPLGRVPVDRSAVERVLKLPQVQVFDDTHADEHSLEVHLPFLQVVLDEFTLVPLVVGQATANQVAEVIEALWGGPETLVVVSSDLSHYLDYDAAQRLDSATCKAIEDLEPERIGRDQACGRIPVGGLLALAKKLGLAATTLDLRNSGDTAGRRDRVVGYGSWMFEEKKRAEGTTSGPGSGMMSGEGKETNQMDFGAQTRALLDRHGATLLHLAAASIENGLRSGRMLPVILSDHAEALADHGASFVTLKRQGKLRGCIGSAQAHRPLVIDVANNGYAAAFNDKRFAKLTAAETADLSLSVSVLSPSTPLSFTSQADLLAQLRPGRDGLIIEDGGKRALFLPAVWESLPDPVKFLGNLKVKAGLAANHWSDSFKAWRFIAEEVSSDHMDQPQSVWSAAGG